MRRTIEVSDFEMNRTRELMATDGWDNPTEDEVFNLALEIRARMRNFDMSASQAFMDIMH